MTAGEYDPKIYWDKIGGQSRPGRGEEPGYFSTGQGEGYDLPSWREPPQYMEHLEPGQRVLDIGSGIGNQVGKLTARGLFAVGCDISPGLLRVARQNCLSHGVEEPRFVLWDGRSLPFPDRSFDVATTNTVLQHVIEEEAVRTIFREVRRVLRPGGRFLISELVAPAMLRTAPHVRLRTIPFYESAGRGAGLPLKSARLSPDVYASICAVYGAARRSSKLRAAGEGAALPASRNRLSQGAKRAARRLCGFLDPWARLLRMERFLVAQATLVFGGEGEPAPPPK